MMNSFISRLPNERDTARTPPTRHVPAQTTLPPVLSILIFSSVRFGLWSRDSTTTAPGRGDR